MIVGHKIDTYLTGTGYWTSFRRTCVITEHVEVRELHATKGWRLIQHRRKDQEVSKLPDITEWRACNTTTFVRTPRAGPVEKPLGWLESVSPTVRDRAINRHKVRRIEIQRAKNLAALAAG